MVRILEVVAGAQNLLGLFQRVLDLAGNEKTGDGGILVVVLGRAMFETEEVIESTGRVKGSHRAAKSD